MNKSIQKEEALKLRKQGRSIKEIASLLKVSQSSVSVWCRDVSLSEQAIKKIARNGRQKSVIGLMKYSELKRIQRQHTETKIALEGKRRVGNLSERDIYCIGLGLYWGEGYKTGSQEFGFTNSDPSMIKFYITWLHVTFNVSTTDLILRVSINESHKKRGLSVESYWSKLTGIPLSQFTKTSYIKSISKKVYSNESMHMGTLRIKVRNGTNFRREVLGAIHSIS